MNRKSRPISPAQFKISDPFWSRYMELIRTNVLPYQWEALNDRIPGAEPSYCMHNFRIAAGLIRGEHKGPVYQDSDLGKWLEAVGYVLSWKKDPELEKIADEAIEIVCAAQQADGYLNSYYILTDPGKRWTNLMDHHELYCLGHLLEGAIAYFEATGKDKLLTAMLAYVDLVDRTFGSEEGKIQGYPGHEELELALIRLYRITGNKNHLKLAKYFIDQRGQAPLYFEEEIKKYGNTDQWCHGPHKFHYYQAGMPVREQHSARGHSVRVVYLCCGIADVARETGDKELMAVCERLWKSITERQMYITGAIGSSPHGEAFSFDFDLPNDTIYGETCAAIGLIFFARRMLEINPDSRYADVMERALYNVVISGMSLDGKSFFYVNPLEVLPEACEKDFFKNHVKPQRQKWFGCSCCPPNLARLLASLASYAYTSGDDETLFMHLFIGGDFIHKTGKGDVSINVKTRYPWEGEVTITVLPSIPIEFKYSFRIPSWCKKYTIQINGKKIRPPIENGYATLSRQWEKGDTIKILFDMPVCVNEANPAVRENIGKIALSRGPIIYCLEEADNGKNIHLLCLPEKAKFNIQYKVDFLEGVEIISSQGKIINNNWVEGILYRETTLPVYKSKEMKWIPYFAWANRGLGEMRVWFNRCF